MSALLLLPHRQHVGRLPGMRGEDMNASWLAWLIIITSIAVLVGSRVYAYVIRKRMPLGQQQRAKLRWQFWIGLPGELLLLWFAWDGLISGNVAWGLAM